MAWQIPKAVYLVILLSSVVTVLYTDFESFGIFVNSSLLLCISDSVIEEY